MFCKRLCPFMQHLDFNKLFYNKSNNILRYVHEFQNIINEQDQFQNDAITNCDTKLLKVAIIGVPNAGKSTLVNSLMDRRVCPASNKVHTTRKRSQAIITTDTTQIIFLDTPGIVSSAESKKYKLEKSFTKDCMRSLNEAHAIGVIHDVSNSWVREKLDRNVIKLLEYYHKRSSFLVLNKIDTLKSKRKLLDITKILTESCINSIPYDENKKPNNHIRGWPNFHEVFMVSALNGDGIQEIRNYLLERALPGKWLYPAEQWTDNSPDDIILRTVQAALLDFLPQEIPYRLQSEIELFETTESGIINSIVLVHCPVERIRNLVVGVGDGKLRQITEKVQKDLLNTFDQPVRLRIIVTTNK